LKSPEKVLRLKERELDKEREELNLLLARERALRAEIEGVERRILELKSQNVESVFQFGLMREAIRELLSEKERLEEQLRELSFRVERKRQEVGRLRGELRLMKELLKKRKLKEERTGEVLNERFIYQVLYSSNGS